jgi:hypothetical protein
VFYTWPAVVQAEFLEYSLICHCIQQVFFCCTTERRVRVNIHTKMAPRELQQVSTAGKLLTLAVTMLFIAGSCAQDVLNPVAAVVDPAAVDASSLVVPETVAVGVPPTGADAGAAAAAISPSAAATTGEVMLTGGAACMDKHTRALDFTKVATAAAVQQRCPYSTAVTQHASEPTILLHKRN